MGATNVKLAYGIWGSRLPDRAFRVLVYMAVISLDTDTERGPARRYYAGREDLAAGALGRVVPADPDPADRTPEAAAARRAQQTVFEAVRAAVSELKTRGAVRELVGGGYRHRATYELMLDLPLAHAQVQGAPASVPDLLDGTSQGEPVPTSQGEPAPTQGEPARRSRASLAPRSRRTTGTTSGPTSLFLPEHPHQGTDHPLHDLEDDDPELTAARATIDRLGPDRYQAALDAVHAEQPDLLTRDLIVAAANRARNGAPR